MASRPSLAVAGGIAPLFALSLLGILASAGFQILVIRQLGPAGFGILAAYFALINVASIGSSAVRNSVAVGVARTDLHRVGMRDRSLLESVLYGSGFAIAVAVMLATGAYTSWLAGTLVLVAIVPYFIFARAQGLMQGDRHVTRVLVWSTAAQIAQLVLALLALSLGAGWLGVLAATALVAVLGAALSTADSRRLNLVSTVRPFMPVTVKALLITIAFTWLISMDVTWVRLFSSDDTAGQYSATTTIVKMAFLVPTTLALYLLPRFARNLHDRSYQLRAVLWSAGAALVSGLLLAIVLWAWPTLLTLVLGSAYSNVETIAVAIAIAFLPWVIAQALVTQVTAQGSVASVVLLVAAAIVQFGLARLVLPNLGAWILAQGVLGVVVLAGLSVVFYLSRVRPVTNSTLLESTIQR